MSAQLSFVVKAAQAKPFEFAVQRARYRLAQRRLADSGRSDEAKYRSLRLRIEFQNSELFENALFHLFEIEVVFVEHLPRIREVQVVLRALGPGQFQNVLEISSYDVVIGSLRRKLLELRELALGFLTHVLRQIGLGQLIPQLICFSLLAGFIAKLLLDRAHLLAKQIIALFLRHFVAGFGCDLIAQLQHLQLVCQVGVHQPQSIDARTRFEQRLLFLEIEAEHRCEQERQP